MKKLNLTERLYAQDFYLPGCETIKDFPFNKDLCNDYIDKF